MPRASSPANETTSGDGDLGPCSLVGGGASGVVRVVRWLREPIISARAMAEEIKKEKERKKEERKGACRET